MLSASLSSHSATATVTPPLKSWVPGQSGTRQRQRSKRKIRFSPVNPHSQQGKKFTSQGASSVTGTSEMATDSMPLISVFIPQNFPIRACERNLMARSSGKSRAEKSRCLVMGRDFSPADRWNVINYLRTLSK